MSSFKSVKTGVSNVVAGESSAQQDLPFPLWATALGFVSVVGLFLYTVAIWGGPAQSAAETSRVEIPEAVEQLDELPVPTTAAPVVAADVATPSSDAPVTSEVVTTSVPSEVDGVVTLNASDGTTLPVPVAVVTTSSDAALAAFTGDFIAVSATPEFVAPTVSTTFPNATVSGDLTVVSSRIGSWVIEVPVAAEPGSGSIPVTIEVVSVGSAWLVQSLR